MYRLIICVCFIIFDQLPLYSQNKINVYSENVTLTTDRDVYIAGEWLYFNLFLVTSPSSGYLNNSKNAYLVLRNIRNEHISDNTVEIKGPSSFGCIFLPDTLATGLYQIVAYTNFMRNYGEDTYFTKSIVIANRFDSHFEFFDNYSDTSDSAKFSPMPDTTNSALLLNKTSYKQREKVRFGIKLSDGSKDALVTVVVRPVSPIAFVENNTKNDSHDLVTKKFTYLPEVNGEIIQGRVLDENNNPISKLAVYLSTPDSIVNLLYSITDKNGIFRFLLNPYYDGKQLYIKVMDVQKAIIELDEKFDLKKQFQPPSLKMQGDFKTSLTRLQKIVSVQKAYSQYFKIDIPTIDDPGYRPLVFSKPKSSIYPSDYIYLPDFMEISRELLPFLKTRLKNQEYTAEIYDSANYVYVKPFIFLDGVLIDNIKPIINLDTKGIYKIETIPNARFLGEIYLPSVLSVFSTKNELKNVKWVLPTITILNTFKLPYSTYSSNNISSSDLYTPDLRQLLYWNPSLNISSTEEKSVEFTTSDCTGNYKVEISGITSDGKTLKYSKIINVTSNFIK
jgi:hypothetical protein